MRRIISVLYTTGYSLEIEFDDGVYGRVDISKFIPFDGVFAILKNLNEFKKFRINRKWGTLEWPGDLELDTESLYCEVTGVLPVSQTRQVSFPIMEQ